MEVAPIEVVQAIPGEFTAPGGQGSGVLPEHRVHGQKKALLCASAVSLSLALITFCLGAATAHYAASVHTSMVVR